MLIIILKLTFVLDYRNSIAETYIVSELGNNQPRLYEGRIEENNSYMRLICQPNGGT